MKNLLLLLIQSYKKYFSPFLVMLGLGHCRFSPTCSEYASKVIKENGSLGGGFLTLKRLIRCQPFWNSTSREEAF